MSIIDLTQEGLAFIRANQYPKAVSLPLLKLNHHFDLGFKAISQPTKTAQLLNYSFRRELKSEESKDGIGLIVLHSRADTFDSTDPKSNQSGNHSIEQSDSSGKAGKERRKTFRGGSSRACYKPVSKARENINKADQIEIDWWRLPTHTHIKQSVKYKGSTSNKVIPSIGCHLEIQVFDIDLITPLSQSNRFPSLHVLFRRTNRTQK